jgi:hypothetical protein
MRRSSRVVALIASGTIALIGWSTLATAQTSTNDNWRFGLTPYAWLTGLDGTTGVGPVTSSVDLSATDVLDMLKFGIMGSGEARKGAWMIAADGIYANLGAGKALAIRGDTGSLEFSLRETVIQPVGGYTIGDGTWSVDLLAGFRYWNLSATLDVDRTRRPSTPDHVNGSTRPAGSASAGFRTRRCGSSRPPTVAAADRATPGRPTAPLAMTPGPGGRWGLRTECWL